MNLYTCKSDTLYKVSKVLSPSETKKQLYFLGFVPGTKVKKVFSSLFKDPMVYEIKNVFIIIRNEDAKYIEVTEFEN